MEDIKQIKIGDVVYNIKDEEARKLTNVFHLIELSTDMNKPTEITDFTKSGTYVAKNLGILGLEGSPLTVLSKGMFFKVFNLKDLYEVTGEKLPDDENMIIIQVMSVEGYYDHILVKQGLNDWEMAGATLNSLNVNDYVNVDIDTSRFIDKYNNVNSYYGVQFNGGNLATVSASEYEIDNKTNSYHVITPTNIDYAVQKKGEKYFATKEELDNSIKTLTTEIEQILDTVVNVNE